MLPAAPGSARERAILSDFVWAEEEFEQKTTLKANLSDTEKENGPKGKGPKGKQQQQQQQQQQHGKQE